MYRRYNLNQSIKSDDYGAMREMISRRLKKLADLSSLPELIIVDGGKGQVNVVKKIFITFLVFPFFSYTILYSPAMQGIGALSLLLWSISILYLKKYQYQLMFFLVRFFSQLI